MQFEGRLLLHYSMKCMSIPAGPRPGFLTTLSPADWSRAHTWWCFFRYKIPKASQLSVVKAYVSTWTLETECAWQCRSCGTQTVSLLSNVWLQPYKLFFLFEEWRGLFSDDLRHEIKSFSTPAEVMHTEHLLQLLSSYSLFCFTPSLDSHLDSRQFFKSSSLDSKIKSLLNTTGNLTNLMKAIK